MTWEKLREPSFWLSTIATAIATAWLAWLIDTYIRPLPIFFDTDPQMWGFEKLGFLLALPLLGILFFRKLRALFYGSGSIVG